MTDWTHAANPPVDPLCIFCKDAMTPDHDVEDCRVRYRAELDAATAEFRRMQEEYQVE